MAEVAAASLLATIGVFDIVGTTASGWLTDRMDRVLLAWYYGLRGLSLLALPTVLATKSVPLLLLGVWRHRKAAAEVRLPWHEWCGWPPPARRGVRRGARC